jgi:hypothetical protein
MAEYLDVLANMTHNAKNIQQLEEYIPKAVVSDKLRE